eukprot:6136130-Pyramimonas_sp.AAC.1
MARLFLGGVRPEGSPAARRRAVSLGGAQELRRCIASLPPWKFKRGQLDIGRVALLRRGSRLRRPGVDWGVCDRPALCNRRQLRRGRR